MIVYGAIAPHPPLIIPEIGGKQLDQCKPTVNGMKELASEVARHSPDLIVIITPHGNVFQDAVSVLVRPTLTGDLSNFGHPDLKYESNNDLEFISVLTGRLEETGLPLVLVEDERHRLNPSLDHGTIVPLHYLEEAGLRDVPLVVLSYGLLSLDVLYYFGVLIQEVAEELERKAVVIASGDMSHRLKSDGPYSFNPDGPVFDEKLAEYLGKGQFLEVMDMPEPLRENAGECGYRSVVMMLGALNKIEVKPQIFSYEGPFGVGYLIAGFEPQGPGPDLYTQLVERKTKARSERKAQESDLVRWARQCLEDYVIKGERTDIPDQIPKELQEEAAVFVSLKKDGHLRGCIGTLQPIRPNIAVEIRENAISAGTQDPRFVPVTADELDDLVYSVDVLGKPELVDDKAMLDPNRYGIIVRSGHKSGVLLPDLEGVDSVEQQIQIACQKAGIVPGDQFEMERFEVIRYR
ncbi:MAG: AmmeMemoRadiSam system protein A [Candidatus Saccharibacteria bacterium]